MRDVDVCTTKEDFAGRKKEWKDILSRADNVPHPFIQYEWIENYVQSLNEKDGLNILFSSDRNTVLPFIRQNGLLKSLTLAGDSFFDYRDALFVGSCGEFGAMVDRQDSSQIVFNRVREDSPLWGALKTLQSNVYNKKIRSPIKSPYVSLRGQTWDDYQSALRKRFRNDIKRQIRRLKEKGSLEFDYCRSAEDLPYFQGVLFQQHIVRRQQQGQGESVFLDQRNRKYFDRLNLQAQKSNTLRLFYLKSNSRSIAVALCYEYGRKLYYYIPTFDIEFMPYSPGRVLFYFIMEYAFQNSIEEVDLMAGGEDYKYDWLARDRSTYDVILSRRDFLGLLCQVRSSVADWITDTKTLLAKSPLKALKQKIYRKHHDFSRSRS